MEKESDPIISIITINYNNKNGLKNTMFSVLTQKYVSHEDIEYIVVDGGSNDGGDDILHEYANRTDLPLQITKWVSEKDSGIYNAMNKGINMSSGKYALFMNSGDTFYSDSVLQQVLKGLDPVADSIVYADTYCNKNDNQGYFWYLPNEVTLDYLYNNGLCHQSTFIPLKILKEFLYDESLKIASDFKLNLQAYLKGITFKKLNVVVSNLDMTGISNTEIEKSLKERESIISSVIPKGVILDIKKRIETQNNSWISYYNSLIRNKSFYKIVLLLVKVMNKVGELLHILHD